METRTCKKCGSSIPKSAIFCPYCHKIQRIPAWVIVLVVLFGLLAYGRSLNANTPENQTYPQTQAVMQEETTTTSTMTTTATTATTTVPAHDPSDDDTIDVDIDDCHVTYLRHEVVKNMAGDKCLAVYYQFTNNSDENKVFTYTIDDKAFQNGVQLETSNFYINDNEARATNVEIKPGITIDVCTAFVLRDETTDIELELEKWPSYDGKVYDSMILSITEE